MYGKIIIVEGIQGAGKSVFCKSCVDLMDDAILMKEWVDEKFLKIYIDDMKTHAANFQRQAQIETVKKLEQAAKLAAAGKTVFIDRGMIGNSCFAEVQHELGFISDEDFASYNSEFDFSNIVEKIELDGKVEVETWFLRCDPHVALQRIRKRNRGGEDSYSLGYLEDLQNRHVRLLSDVVKIVDVSQDQPLHDGLLHRTYVRSIIVETYNFPIKVV